MEVYILLNSDYTQILSLSTNDQLNYTKVTLKDNTIDLSKLPGYKMTIENDIKYLERYIKEYCSIGAKTFLLKKEKNLKNSKNM